MAKYRPQKRDISFLIPHRYLSGAAHRIAAVEALVAGTVADGDRAADVAGGGIVHEVLELSVKLLHDSGLRLSAG